MKLIIANLFAFAGLPCRSFTLPSLNGFTKSRGRNHGQTSHAPSHFGCVSRSQLCCICINCAWVTNCTAYHFVEEKHEQPHLNANPTFTPRDGSPTIHVNIRPPDIDSTDIWKERQSESEQAMGKGSERGEMNNDLIPETTVEYDVVKCADFQLDEGCWVRNMPEEIKRANPDFVPT